MKKPGAVTIDAGGKLHSTRGEEAPLYHNGSLHPMRNLAEAPIHHGHDAHVLENVDLIVMQFNAEQTYPLQLEKLSLV